MAKAQTTHFPALALGLLLLTAICAGAAPGDLAGDFMGFGTGGKVENLGLDAVRKATVDDFGRLIVVGQLESQLAVQRRTEPRYALRLAVPIDPSTTSEAVDVAIAPDGKIVVAGNVATRSGDFVVVRLNADLTLDSTFEGDGIAVVDIDGSRADRATAVAVQADRKIVVVGGGTNAEGFVGVVIRLNENGTLDDTFDDNGKKAFNDIDTMFEDVAVQADGKIVVIASVLNQILVDYEYRVGRLVTSGALDPTFNGGNFVSTDFDDLDDDNSAAVAIAPDGRIVVAGDTLSPSETHIRIARYLSNGTLDATFDGDGLLIDDVPTYVTDAVVQHDGKIVIIGYHPTAQPKGFFLTRYNVGGDRDATFGSLGRVLTFFSVGTAPTSLTAQADGMLVAAGGRAAARYRPDGSLDAGGTATLPFARSHAGSEATALAVDSAGYLVAAGKVFREDYDMALARVTPGGGGPDITFGTDGFPQSGQIVYGLRLQSEEIRAVTTQADREIVVAGEVNTQANGQNFLVGRFNQGGNYDLGCSFVGFTSIHYGTGDDRANAVAVAEDNRIYAAGTVRGPSSDDFGAVRLNTACRVDVAGGGSSAPVEYKPRRDLGGQETGVGLLRQGGRVVLAGSSGNDITLTRLASPSVLTGTVRTDTSFGEDGIAKLDLGQVESASGLAAQPDGKLIVAGTINRGGTSDFLVARFSADGDLDASFGSGAVPLVDFNALDVATSVAVRGDGSIAVAGYTVGTAGPEFAVAQLTPEGLLDLAFSGDGKATVRIGAEGVANAVTFFGGDRIVLGGYATVLGLRQFALAGFETTADVTVPTTTSTSLPGETTTTTTEPGATTSTTTVVSGGTTTTAQLPGTQEVCGNCRDDDGDGLVDFEDPACCPAGTTAMTLKKLGIAAGRKGTKFALAAALAESGVPAGTASTQDVFLQVATAEQDLLCAHVPAANLKRKKARLRFKDAAHAVVSAGNLERLKLRAKKDGSGALAAASKSLPGTVPSAGTAVITLGLRDPGGAEAGNRCARAQAALEASKKGALQLP